MPAQTTARIFNIQRYSIYDGPGVRSLVFFQGCPLQCLWCSNPEGQSSQTKLLYRSSRCVHCGLCVNACPEGLHALVGSPARHAVAHQGCTGCGACVRACPEQALALSGEEKTLDDILDIVLTDRDFYETSDGGLTLGGGEPLLQWQAAAVLLRACRAEGINTSMETSGHAAPDIVRQLAPHVDLFLYDLKHMEPAQHKKLTGVDNALILANLSWLLNNDCKVRVRMPLVNGCNTNMDEMRARVAFLEPWKEAPNFLGVDLLPYHRMGVGKYVQLGMAYTLDADAVVSERDLTAIQALFRDAGMNVAIIRH